MRRRRQHGFALLLVFAMMSAAAVMIYLQFPRFVMEAQRSKEQLLIDRGEQYQRAIQLYYRKMKTWPQSLDDLEKGNNTRFLRRRYLDPFTGKAEWRLVHVNNGVYTDSLVYNSDPNGQKEKRQTFVAELPSIGNNGADGGDEGDNPNRALQARASDRSADPLDELPEALRAFVYRGSIAPRGERPIYNADDDVQAPLPTPGVYGAQGLDISNLSPQQIMAGAGAAQAGDVGAPAPVPGVGGVSFEEIQRRMAEQAANGGGQPSIGGGAGGGFIGTSGGISNAPYTPTPQPGAAGLSYSAIAGNNGNYATNNTPPVPGTGGGFPTGINPSAPAFGSSGSGFIGGAAAVQAQANQAALAAFGQPQPGGPAGFGQARPQGFGNPGAGANPGAVGAPTGDAAALLNNALFGPRQQGATGGTAAGGSGLVGVASKYKGETVKVYREKSRFQHWEFIYDPAKDTSAKAAAQQLPGAPLPGGLPPGTAQQPGQGLGPNPAQQLPVAVPGTRFPNPAGQGGGGFGNTGQTGGFGSGGSFIGGPAPNTAPIPITPAPNPGNSQPRPGQQQPPAQPPRPGGGGFIGGR